MGSSTEFLNASDAASRLGVSAKALRLYEQRGLLVPVRTAAGWRTYGPEQMARAGEIVAMRALGLSLAQAKRVLGGDPRGLDAALATHQSVLEGRMLELSGMMERLRQLRDRLRRGEAPARGELVGLVTPATAGVGFELPWPWGGERFELGPARALTYIIGPLGSGKTRLAQKIAEVLPGALFLGMDRLVDGLGASARLETDAALRERVERTLAWLVEDGAVASDALTALCAGLETDWPTAVVIDMLEEGLEQASQEAVVAYLRHRGAGARPVFAMTRSNAVLDLAAVGPDEAIILCPANHSPPTLVAPYPGATGYEAVATCLATPDVRARVARPQVA
ncbi:MAG TPA: MerR family transcriptional regulator [Devosia sp.]|jgi:DNA-binding transcriptional MerR regulator|uniref:MerR family transcriptional regulator n=1 Tax=Devosia sp. TaxID=1871048 RepID=UPI002DDDBB45|nr:MerR family transcriptional regulator [Devosia sp.]HEV2515234.1 MerR family transcriptional regulator [Devosia sp.]